MDLQLNNPINNPRFNSGPDGLEKTASNRPIVERSVGSSSVENLFADEPMRTRGSRLADLSSGSRITEAKESSNKLQGLNIIESAWNSVKKLGRSVCLAGGWASASAAVVSMLFLNIKVLGILFGIPAVLFLYTAATLGRDIKTDPMSGIVKDPLNSLKHILEKHPEALRDDPKFVIKTIQAVGFVKKNDPRYYEVMDRLGALEDSVSMERAKLRNKDDELSLAYLDQMEDYLNEIRKLERI
jgi:hypothetical protein